MPQAPIMARLADARSIALNIQAGLRKALGQENMVPPPNAPMPPGMIYNLQDVSDDINQTLASIQDMVESLIRDIG
jgi:hypothetical protein